jgi:hypothetical protein
MWGLCRDRGHPRRGEGILGLWAGTGSAGAKFWMAVLIDIRHRGVWSLTTVQSELSRDERQCHKSMRMTTRRGDGRETSLKPALANVFSVPTCSSSDTTFRVVRG